MDYNPSYTRRIFGISGRAWLAFALVFALLLTAAVPALAQADEPVVSPLMLGEYARAELAAGESAAFGIVLSEDGDYLITPVDSEAAAAFDILITDGEGAIVFDDTFADTELTMTAGNYTLTFTAVEDGSLFFVMLGTFGELSQNADDPGKMIPGGIVVTTAASSDDHVGVLTVPPLDVAQQVLIYVASADPGDFLFAYVEGASVYEFIDAQESSLLSFWTQGGDYTVTVSPAAKGQVFTLIPFLSGPPPTVDVGGAWEYSMEPGADEVLALISLDTLYTELTINLSGTNDDADLDLRFVDHLEEGGIYETSTDSGSQESVTLENVLPGNYYVVVHRYVDEAVDFTVTVEGTPGEPMEVLESGVPVDGSLVNEDLDEETVYYEFNVDEAGSLVQVDLLSDNEDAYFEVNVGRRPGTATWYGYYDYETGGVSTEFLATQPGKYYIGVMRSGPPAEFSLFVENTGPAPMLAADDFVRGTLTDGATALYQLEITEPGQVLSLLLVSLADNDLDLRLTLYDKYGGTVHSQTSTEAGGVESVTQAMVTPGLYEVQIRAYDDDSYYLFTELFNPVKKVTVSLDVTNMTGADVCAIVTIPAGAEEGVNQLAEDAVLGDDENVMITLDTDTYALEAYNCDNELVASESDVFLQGDMFWNLLTE